MLFSQVTNAAPKSLSVFTEELPPYQFLDIITHKVIGATTRVVQKTLKCAGYKGQFSIVPWNRAYKETLQSKNTLIYSMARLKEREKKFHWIGIIGYTESYIYKLKKRIDINIRRLEDAKNYRIGLLKDDFVTLLFINEGFVENEHFSYYLDSKSKLPMLFDGRYDLIEGNPLVMKIRASNQKFDFDEIMKIFPVIRKMPLYLAMNINSDKVIVEKLQGCLKEMADPFQ